MTITFTNFLIALVAVGIVAGVLRHRTLVSFSTKGYFYCLLMFWGAISIGVVGGYMSTLVIYIFKDWRFENDQHEALPNFLRTIYVLDFLLTAFLAWSFISIQREDEIRRLR